MFIGCIWRSVDGGHFLRTLILGNLIKGDRSNIKESASASLCLQSDNVRGFGIATQLVSVIDEAKGTDCQQSRRIERTQ
jgi:hypothetical protein